MPSRSSPTCSTPAVSLGCLRPHCGLLLLVLQSVLLQLPERCLLQLLDCCRAGGCSQVPGLIAAAAAFRSSSLLFADASQLQMGSREAQLDMLARVLAAGESDAGVETLPEGAALPGGKQKLTARRKKGNMAALTGAGERLYMVSRHLLQAHLVGPQGQLQAGLTLPDDVHVAMCPVLVYCSG